MVEYHPVRNALVLQDRFVLTDWANRLKPSVIIYKGKAGFGTPLRTPSHTVVYILYDPTQTAEMTDSWVQPSVWTVQKHAKPLPVATANPAQRNKVTIG